jgi:hypothetical protein
MSESGGSNYNLGFIDLLAVAFIVLKLTGVIDWSWWWVLSPLLLVVGMYVVVIVAALAVGIYGLKKGREDRNA